MKETKPIKFLEAESIFLRPFEDEDMDSYFYEAFWDKDLRKMTGMKSVYSREGILNFIKNSARDETSLNLLICLQDNNQMIGDIALKEIDYLNRKAKVDLSIFQTVYRGKGYGTEALRLIIDYSFDQLNLHRIGLDVYSFNKHARYVYEKLGFRQEGMLRKSIYSDGEYFDTIIMGLLKEEWNS